MMNAKTIYFILILSSFSFLTSAQTNKQKKSISEDEITFLQNIIEDISVSDQKYRKYLASNTLDDKVLEKLDQVYDSLGLEAMIEYEQSLDLKLATMIEDSLWQLQHQIDLRNHLTLRGIFQIYGYLSKDILGKKTYIQLLLLLHPPKDWDVEQYLREYSHIFLNEVNSGRMPGKTYATFFDNITGKILKRPQLYGTNMQFDSETKKILSPGIKDINATNEARQAIGMKPLHEGEYRIVE